jgi:cobalt-zinc-cadmium efflux system outer membrane protein
VGLADARLTAARRNALHFRDVLVPMREEVVAQAQLHYNGMFLGLYQLLAVKQSELDARRGLIEATRDYWIARADLARAVGGRLPAPAPPAPATSPAVSSNRQGNRAP